MPGYVNLIDSATNNAAGVNDNKEIKVALSASEETAGFAKLLDGTGERLKVTDSGALLSSGRELILVDQVDGSSLNTNRWTTSTSGMTVAQAGGYITLNSGSVTTTSSYAILQSIKSIPMYGALPIVISANVKAGVQPQANAVMEFGIGTVSGTSAPTDGCFFRWNSAGEFRAVENNNGTETSSSVLTAPTTNTSTLLEIEIVENEVAFFINDEEVAIVSVPAALAFPTNSGRLPVFLRVYTLGSAPASAPVLSLGQLTCMQFDMVQRKDWSVILAALGNAAYQSPTAFTQSANHANSTSPTSATLSNTVAGYTTLGGRYQFAAVAGAATDYALFGFQVPAGYQLYITSIAISCVATGANLATTATILDWGIGINASAVSLATAESPPTTWAPRRIPLGIQGFFATDVIGKVANDIVRAFNPPLVADAGRFVHVILQIPVGSATGSQIFRGDVTISGYFE